MSVNTGEYALPINITDTLDNSDNIFKLDNMLTVFLYINSSSFSLYCSPKTISLKIE